MSTKTLIELVEEAGDLVGRTDAEMAPVIRKSINRRHRFICRKFSWPELYETVSLTISAGNSTVGIPLQVAEVRSVFNVSTGSPINRLDPVTLEERFGVSVTSTGAPSHFAVDGLRGTMLNFTGTGSIYVTSSSALDSVDVRVEGYDGDNMPYTMTGTVNGTSQITLSNAAANFAGATVRTFSKSSDTVGDVSLVENGITLGSIAPTERRSGYKWLRFDRAADQDTSIRVAAKIQVPDLVQDSDMALLQGIDDCLVVGAVSDTLRRLSEYEKATREELRFMELVNDAVNEAAAEAGETIQAQGTMHKYRTNYEYRAGDWHGTS